MLIILKMDANFASATGGVLTVFSAAPSSGNSVWLFGSVDEVSGTIFERESTADTPAATQFLSHQPPITNASGKL